MSQTWQLISVLPRSLTRWATISETGVPQPEQIEDAPTVEGPPQRFLLHVRLDEMLKLRLQAGFCAVLIEQGQIPQPLVDLAAQRQAEASPRRRAEEGRVAPHVFRP